MVGSAIVHDLTTKGYTNIVFANRERYDLRNQSDVIRFFETEHPEHVILAAAKVGGIVANNTYRADFIYDNIMIQNNVIHESYRHGVKKLLFLGSSCIYPKNSPQPISENDLLTNTLEYTNEPYAIAKIAGIKMCESYNLQYGTNFISVMPTNLYGFRDNFDLERSHVLPALIRKMHLAKSLMNNDWESIHIDLQKNPIPELDTNSTQETIQQALSKYGIYPDRVELWGSGKPRREFMHASDLADACVFLLEQLDFSSILQKEYDIQKPTFPLTSPNIINTHINIGVGHDYSIRELSEILQSIIGYRGEIHWDTSKPDGTFQKLLNVDKLHNYGWKAQTDFKKGLQEVYHDYISPIILPKK